MLNKLNRMVFALSFVLISTMGCNRESEPESLAQGVGSSIGASILIPQPKSPKILRSMVMGLGRSAPKAPITRGTSSLHATFKTELIKAVTDVGGLPRWQIRQILVSLVRQDSLACGGVSCGRILGLDTADLETYLDDIYQVIRSSDTLASSAANQQKMRSLLLGSFTRDYDLPPNGALQESVPFKNAEVQAAVQQALRNEKNPLARENLQKVTNLSLILHTLDGGQHRIGLEDLLKLPNLKSLEVSTDSVEVLTEIAKFGDGLTHLVVSWTPTSSYMARVSDVEILGSMPRLSALTLRYMSIHDADRLAATLPDLRHLTIDRPTTKVTNDTMAAIGEMKNLRIVGFHGVSYQDLNAISVTLPKSVTTVEYVSSLKPRYASRTRIDKCGDMSAFRIFANASTMTVEGCIISDIRGFGRPVAWQILSLKNCLSEENKILAINPSTELQKLMVFHNDGSPNLDLTAATKQEITVRLASNPKH